MNQLSILTIKHLFEVLNVQMNEMGFFIAFLTINGIKILVRLY